LVCERTDDLYGNPQHFRQRTARSIRMIHMQELEYGDHGKKALKESIEARPAHS